MKNSFTIIYPDGKVEKKIEGEVTNQNALIKKKQHLNQSKRGIKYFFGALKHALHWNQLKQSFNYPNLVKLVKKRWYVGTAVVAAFIFFLIPRTEEKFPAQLEPNLPHQQASVWGLNQVKGTNQGAEKQKSEVPSRGKAQAVSAKQEEEQVSFRMPAIPEASRKESAIFKELGRHAKDIRDAYINRYAKIAKAEQQKFGIPASVTLGLAILQSDFGTNIVAKEGANHLMIPCDFNPIPMGKGMIGQGVHRGVCYTRYESVWTSFRAHSEMIKRNYASIKEQAGSNYKKWAKGLEAAGYFREGYNANALIQTIQKYQLNKFDKNTEL